MTTHNNETLAQPRARGASPPVYSAAEHTRCCIVGAGPGGAMLALLLARKGVPVTLLEAHHDFDRDFRGDTLHASALEVLDQIGLADNLLQLRHAKVTHLDLPTRDGPIVVNLFGALDTKFPFITVMAQSRFLEFITAEAGRYPDFRLVMNARVDALIDEGGVIRGVRYRDPAGEHELRASLTVAADGRFSTVRKLAHLDVDVVKTASRVDVLWFRVSRRDSDPTEALAGRVGSGLFAVFIDRFDYWQVGCTLIKGGFGALKASGLAHFRETLGQVAPEWADRLHELQDWKQTALLSVESSRLKCWHRPGLLLIGDAAHVMSPVGGVGINYAIQDAVVACNALAPKLTSGEPITDNDVAEVQRQREWPTRVIQTFQSLAQRAVSGVVIGAGRDQAPMRTVPRFILPLLNLPWILKIPARLISYGVNAPRLLAP